MTCREARRKGGVQLTMRVEGGDERGDGGGYTGACAGYSGVSVEDIN